ncbi:hypothetical protein N7481_010182 [Penicillium waksmanii]|uniref:uncharacterized protein n=1 Tax=Penicillium waksmanii TaxID=69791 RepID=UPI00254922B3|nr:uncharacterized protein N7481_010182 [Penicillium waksmanii]KAJ5976475.1 hypothetical protein N7481_010182 [Penicillium waksmanii]
MKSPIFILAALLPLATQVAMANPVAAANSDSSLEERGGNWNGDLNHGHGGKGWDNHWDDDDRPQDWCKVKQPYWYHKYPCDSSGTVGESKVGDNFAPVCKYQNWYKNPKGWWVKDEYKPRRCQVNVGECKD